MTKPDLCGRARSARVVGWGFLKSEAGAGLWLVRFVATENVEDVKSLAGIINLKSNPPLADPQAVLRRFNPC